MKHTLIIAILFIFGCSPKPAYNTERHLGTDTTIVSDRVSLELIGEIKTISDITIIAGNPVTRVGTRRHFTKDGFVLCEVLTMDSFPDKRGDSVMWRRYFNHKYEGYSRYIAQGNYYTCDSTRYLLLTDTSYVRYLYSNDTNPIGEYKLSYIGTTFLSRDKHILRTTSAGYSEDGNEKVSSSERIYQYSDSSLIEIEQEKYGTLISNDTTIKTIIKRDSLGNPTVYYTQRKYSLFDNNADTTYSTYEYYD